MVHPVFPTNYVFSFLLYTCRAAIDDEMNAGSGFISAAAFAFAFAFAFGWWLKKRFGTYVFFSPSALV